MSNPDSGQTSDQNPAKDIHTGSSQPSASAAFGKGMAGQRIAHYTIIRELGKGGQGSVYLAKDEKLHREVALKLLNHVQVTNVKARLRFVREAETASKLNHPGLCAVHEFGEFEGIPYITMQYIPGTPLSKRIAGAAVEDNLDDISFVAFGESTAAITPSAEQQRPGGSTRSAKGSGATDSSVQKRSAVTQVVHMIEKVARALHAAHEENLVHRDIKPDNIIISDDGNPVILDFGLARDDESEGATLTQAGDIMGTPAYMSPEQITRSSLRVDRRCDIYSLGVTLYECLTLKRPFKSVTREALYQSIMFKDAPNPRKLNPAISEDLRIILAMAMEKDPKRRYQTAEDFAEDLRRLRENKPIHARAAGPLVKTTKWVQRNPAVATLSVVVFVSLIASATVFYLKSEEAQKAQAAEEKAKLVAQEESRQKSVALEQKSIALAERDAALADYNRLGDIKRLARANTESDALYPPSPDLVPKLQAWLEEHRDIADRLEDHKRFLDALRAQAQPYTEAERDRDFSIERNTLAEIKDLAVKIEKELENPGSEARRKSLENQQKAVTEQIAELSETVKGRRSWSFGKNAELTLQHDIITDLVRDLTVFATDELAPMKSVPERIKLSQTIEPATIAKPASAWKECCERIRTSKRYGGLELRPQLGLIPLGPDKRTGLEEFLVWLTHKGDLPKRHDTGALAHSDDLGIILVLIPGGSFLMGAQKDDPSAPNYDPNVQDKIESPVHEVTLEPFFLAKYEMSQAQWQRVTGKNLSAYGPGVGGNHPAFPAAHTIQHPVENISWIDARDTLRKVGLCLPTEAEWEMAARAGGYSMWSGADNAEELRKAANLGGTELAGIGFANQDPNHKDAYPLHCPVGSFAPNAFGLYDMTGNVWEWCEDGDFGYTRQTISRGLRGRPESSPRRIFRGGGFTTNGQGSRITLRNTQAPTSRQNTIGVRPAKLITK